MTKMTNEFFWGNSVSSMQTEGAWNEDGKGMSVYDIREAGEHTSDWKVAIDSYHQYETDFDLMQDLGMNFYRFQISWSRVNPQGDGAFNEAGIAFYDKFIDELLARGIEPMICLYHFDMPLHLAQEYNGFVDRHVMDAFITFGKEMMKRFGHKVRYWITFNEQNLYHMSGAFQGAGYLEGERTLTELYLIQHHIMMGHAFLANHMHAVYPDCQIGGMLAYMEVYPATCKPKDVFITRKFDEFINQNLLRAFSEGRYSDEVLAEMKTQAITGVFHEGDLAELSKLRSDFIAFSYYYSTTLSGTDITDQTPVSSYLDIGKQDNPYIGTTEWNWQIDPLGFRNVINQIYAKTGLPIFPIENGVGVRESMDDGEIQDDYRIDYHKAHIKAMMDAMNYDGVPIIGYLGWGWIDILSSQGDMRKRYGVVYVNRDNHDLKDLKRIPKKSFYWLKEVIASNGATL